MATSRLLEVLRDYGPGAVVASICPKHTTSSANDPYFGYQPAIHSLVRSMRTALVE